MIRIFSCLALVTMLAAWAPAWAAGNFYATLSGGVAIMPDPEITDTTLPGVTGEVGTEPGFSLSGAIGYRYDKRFRGEIELAYRENDIDRLSITAFGLAASGSASGDVSSFSGMVNGYWDIAIDAPVKPYVGAGVGISEVEAELTVGGTTAKSDDTVFAYQFMGGVIYEVSPTVDIHLGYRYFATADPEFSTTESEYETHNVEVGVTYKF